MDMEEKVRGNTDMIESLQNAIHNINDNVVSMDGAFTKILADTVNDIKSLGSHMASFEEALNGLFTQMIEVRSMLEHLMHATTENNNRKRNGPETIQVTPVSHTGSGAVFSPEESPPTPVGIRGSTISIRHAVVTSWLESPPVTL